MAQLETKEHFVNEIIDQTPYSSWGKVYLSDTADSWGKFEFFDSINITPKLKKSIPDSTISQLITNCNKSPTEKWNSTLHIKTVNTSSEKFQELKPGTMMYKHKLTFISNVVFDNRQEFAMIRIGKNCGESCGESCTYFFKKTNNNWKLVLKEDCVMW